MKGGILLKHLSAVNDAVKDLKIEVKGGENPSLSYSFAAMTHYLEVTDDIPEAVVKNDGELIFSDIPKKIAFLKKSKGDVVVKQMLNNRLSIASGKKKITIPCFEVNSSQLVGKYSRLLDAGEKSGGVQFSTAVLSLGARFNMKEIKDIASMGKLIPKDAEYKVQANATENEVMVKVSKGGNASLFATADLEDTEGGEGTITSSFGHWLLPCLMMMNDGKAKMYMGDGTPLILNQGVDENHDGGFSRTLVVIDQED